MFPAAPPDEFQLHRLHFKQLPLCLLGNPLSLLRRIVDLTWDHDCEHGGPEAGQRREKGERE